MIWAPNDRRNSAFIFLSNDERSNRHVEELILSTRLALWLVRQIFKASCGLLDVGSEFQHLHDLGIISYLFG